MKRELRSGNTSCETVYGYQAVCGASDAQSSPNLSGCRDDDDERGHFIELTRRRDVSSDHHVEPVKRTPGELRTKDIVGGLAVSRTPTFRELDLVAQQPTSHASKPEFLR